MSSEQIPEEFKHVEGQEYEYSQGELGPGRVERAGSREFPYVQLGGVGVTGEEEEEEEQGPPKMLPPSHQSAAKPYSKPTTTTVKRSASAGSEGKPQGPSTPAEEAEFQGFSTEKSAPL